MEFNIVITRHETSGSHLNLAFNSPPFDDVLTRTCDDYTAYTSIKVSVHDRLPCEVAIEFLCYIHCTTHVAILAHISTMINTIARYKDACKEYAGIDEGDIWKISL